MIRYEFCCPDCGRTMSTVLYVHTTITVCMCGYIHVIKGKLDDEVVSADHLSAPYHEGLPLWNADGLKRSR